MVGSVCLDHLKQTVHTLGPTNVLVEYSLDTWFRVYPLREQQRPGDADLLLCIAALKLFPSLQLGVREQEKTAHRGEIQK